MMGQTTACLYWDIGRGRYERVCTVSTGTKTVFERLLWKSGLSTMEHDIPVGKAEEGAEAVARHGGTLEFIAECLKGREMEDDRQKGGKKTKNHCGK